MVDSATPIRSMLTTVVVVVAAIFPALSFISIALRWKSRTIGRNGWKADDWWIVATWFPTLGVSINAWVFTRLAGRDYYKVDPLTGSMYSAQALFVGTLFLQPALAAVKISILLFYKRVFPTPAFSKAAWAAIVAVTSWAIIFEILVVLQGDPVSHSWTGIGRNRFDIVAFGLAQAGTSLALDVIILLFPIPIVWNLHLQTRRKIAVAIIFWLGGFCCVAAIVRLVLLHQVLFASVSSAEDGYNLLYIQSKAYVFTIIEPNCSIIAACLPCYGTLVRSMGGRNLESVLRSVRSALSLGSRQSSNAGNGSGRGSGSGSQSRRRGEAIRLGSSKGRSDSEVELTELENGSTTEADQPAAASRNGR